MCIDSKDNKGTQVTSILVNTEDFKRENRNNGWVGGQKGKKKRKEGKEGGKRKEENKRLVSGTFPRDSYLTDLENGLDTE